MRISDFLKHNFMQKFQGAFTNLALHLSIALVVLGNLVEPAFAQVAVTAEAQPSFTEVLTRMFPMFALVFMIYYFMIVKPQQLKVKTQADLTASLKKGDTVVTSGGIFGRVSAIETDGISVEIAPNVKMKVELAHIARKVELETAANSAGNSPVSRVK